MIVVPDKKNLQSGLKLTSVVEVILIEQGALKTICFFFWTEKNFSALFLLYNDKNLHLYKVCLTVCFLSLHESFASLEQVRWIYAATELATSDPRRAKLVGRVDCRLEFELFIVLLKMSPHLLQTRSRQAEKKNTCIHTYFFFRTVWSKWLIHKSKS